jgi:hypothetical protein
MTEKRKRELEEEEEEEKEDVSARNITGKIQD